MAIIDKNHIKAVLDEFNLLGKSLEDIELENEAKQQKAMVENANNPVLKKIWADAKKDAQIEMQSIKD